MPTKVASLLDFIKSLLIISSIILLKFNVSQVQAQVSSSDTEQITPITDNQLEIVYLSFTLKDQENLERTWSFLKEKATSQVNAEIERIRLEKERKKTQEQLRQQTKTKLAKSKNSNPQPVRITGDFESTIRSACNDYGCNPEQLIRVMYCESGGRSNAVNGVYSGLFQFHPNTFQANANRIGLTNADIWNPYHQIQVAAWMFANGQAWQWGCK